MNKLKKIDAPEGIPLPHDLSYDVIILPEKLIGDGVGVYPDASVDMLKELRADGIKVSYLHPADKRSWLSKHSFEELPVEFVVGILSSGGWAALVYLFRKLKPDSKVRGKIARYKRTPEGESWEWYELEGTAEDVIKVLDDSNSR